MGKLKSYIQIMRVYQWVKNLFVFLPLFFAFKITDVSLITLCVWAFFGISFVASSIYIINDWCDIESDRLHPSKKNRPLASGAIGKTEALILVAILLLCGFGIYLFAINDLSATLLLAGYFAMNLSYSFKLKHVPIVDVTIVAIGFVIRIFIGGMVADIPLSQWIVIMTFLLALLLAVGKRRDDVLIFMETGNKARKNLDGYNLEFLNAIIIIMSGIIIVAYIMYTISPQIVEHNGKYLYLSSIFVILGLLRYLQIVFVNGDGGNPTKIFIKDRFMHFILLGWLATFLVLSLVYR